ncbi:MAG: RNA polymerase sigma factor [Planctomycetaceae bacterium]
MTEAADNIWNRQILEHETWLRTVVRSRVSTVDEADDVMQTIIADAIAFADKQQEVRSLGPWLYRMAVNAVLQFRRTCGRRRRLHDRYSEQNTNIDPTEPLDLILGSEQKTQVQTALTGMSGEDVEILMLKYVHGWNYTQISEHLGLEGHRVANRLRRARNRLKEQLRRQGLDADEVTS